MRSISFILLALLTVSRDTRAEDTYGYQDDVDDGGNVNDYQETYSNGDDKYSNNEDQQNSGESIQYWTEYAILPKRCIR